MEKGGVLTRRGVQASETSMQPCTPRVFLMSRRLRAVSMRVRLLIMRVEGTTLSRYEYATGCAPPLHLIRIFGSPMYGFVLAEQRRALRLDKADPTAVRGDYVGFDITSYAFKNVTLGKLSMASRRRRD